MVRIGITGGTGAGKSEVARILARLTGWLHIDADEVYRRLLEDCEEMRGELISEFGALENIRITDRLNEITHKYVKKEIEQQCTENAIVDAALLIESGFNETCDFTIAVVANPEVRKKRVILRDELNAEQAESRMAAQRNNEFYSTNADATIKNSGNFEELEKECEELSKQLLRL